MKLRLLFSLIGVILLSLGINMLITANLGLTPFDTFCMYISMLINTSYANATFIVHSIIFVILLFFHKKFKESIKLVLLSLVSIFIITRFISFFSNHFIFYKNYPVMLLFIIGVVILSIGLTFILKSDLVISPADKIVDGISVLENKETWVIKFIVEFIFLFLTVIGSRITSTNVTITIYTFIFLIAMPFIIDVFGKLFVNKIKINKN